MDKATKAHVQILAEEYVALVEAMRAGQYEGEDEYRSLSSQRSTLHDALIALTGITDRPAMYGHCRELMAKSRLKR